MVFVNDLFGMFSKLQQIIMVIELETVRSAIELLTYERCQEKLPGRDTIPELRRTCSSSKNTLNGLVFADRAQVANKLIQSSSIPA